MLVGVAVVRVGPGLTAFAWAHVDGETLAWDGRGADRLHGEVNRTLAPTASFRRPVSHDRGAAQVEIGATGALVARVPVVDGALTIRVTPTSDRTTWIPATLFTRTPHGGWNATDKVAGDPARLTVEHRGPGGIRRWTVEAGCWRDATVGGQDRRTLWRWAAGSGNDADGRRVGLNLSSGMNGAGEAENLVWWDGTPWSVSLRTLEPASSDEWRLAGDGWELRAAVMGTRAAVERFGPIRSDYTQPIVRFAGTLPSPDGPRSVEMLGVTEHHEAVW